MTRSTMVVVPCRNEARRIEPDAFLGYVREEEETALLFVDDDSTDDTRRVLEEMAAERPGAVSVLGLDSHEHGGKAEAVRRGILAALEGDPRFVGYLDADLATPLREVSRLRQVLEEEPEVSFVLGSRVQLLGRTIRRRPLRHYFGRVFATAASLVLGIPVYDTQCGAKLLRVRPETRGLFEEPFHSPWIFDVELLARFLERRADDAPSRVRVDQLYEVPLERWTDVEGSQVRLKDFVQAPLDLLRIRLRYDLPVLWQDE